MMKFSNHHTPAYGTRRGHCFLRPVNRMAPHITLLRTADCPLTYLPELCKQPQCKRHGVSCLQTALRGM